MDGHDIHRAGFVALGGRSNVGKSTLLNRIVGRKVAAVTPRPQTTRRRILGIRTDPDAQLLLIDMPGMQESKGALGRQMFKTARSCIAEGEVIVAVVEAAGKLKEEDAEFLASIRAISRPKVIAANKIDLVSRQQLIPMLEQCAAAAPGAEVVPISALTGENVDELIATVKRLLPESPNLMPADEYTDQTERMLAEEVIREKVFFKMRQEIPFSTAVKVEQFTEEPERNFIRIGALIIVARQSHKGMVIGAGGAVLKEIGTAARHDLEQIFGSRVFLELRVRVEQDWAKHSASLKEYGL